MQLPQELAAPAAPSTPLSFSLRVIYTRCSFVTAIKLSCSCLPGLLAALPSQALLPRSMSLSSWARPNLPLLLPLPSHSISLLSCPLWVIAPSEQDLLATSDTQGLWKSVANFLQICCSFNPMPFDLMSQCSACWRIKACKLLLSASIEKDPVYPRFVIFVLTICQAQSV